MITYQRSKELKIVDRFAVRYVVLLPNLKREGIKFFAGAEHKIVVKLSADPESVGVGIGCAS